jgi:Xaa-Pro dipeptidase
MDTRHPPAFSSDEYQRRLRGLRDGMRARAIDTLLVFVPENICYLTGYETIGYASFAALVVRHQDEPALLVREMERTVAETTTWLSSFVTFSDTEDPVEQTLELLRRHGWLDGTVAVEQNGWFVSPAIMDRLRRLLGDVADGSGLVERGRRVKSSAEIELIRRACRVTEAGMAAACGAIHPGATENEVAVAAYAAMMTAGSDFMVGDPIVTSGWRSGVAHCTFANRSLEAGDTILIELGGCQRRYFGPLMRGAAIPPVRPEAERMAEVIVGALNAAIAAIRPGVTSGQVDAVCRGILEDAGYEPYFRKRTGYSVGVAYGPDWGEGHILSLRRDDPTPLEPGMVFHMPPALRIPRQYGLGFSETVLVTPTGCEVLTWFPRRLHVAGGSS